MFRRHREEMQRLVICGDSVYITNSHLNGGLIDNNKSFKVYLKYHQWHHSLSQQMFFTGTLRNYLDHLGFICSHILHEKEINAGRRKA